MRSYPARHLGFQLYARKRHGMIPLFRKESKKGLHEGLFFKEYDSQGKETLKPLRSGIWIWDEQAHKMPYIRDRWGGEKA